MRHLSVYNGQIEHGSTHQWKYNGNRMGISWEYSRNVMGYHGIYVDLTVIEQFAMV